MLSAAYSLLNRITLRGAHVTPCLNISLARDIQTSRRQVIATLKTSVRYQQAR